MASAKSLAKVTLSRFSPLTYLRRSSYPWAPSTTRRFTTTIPKNDTSYDAAAAARLDDVFLRNNPFLSAGPICPLESKVCNDGLYMRVDMPGVGKEGLKVWMKGNSVYFEGNGPRESKHDASGRGYKGSIQLVPDSSYFKTDQMVVEVKDGVVRFLIPHNTLEEKKKEKEKEGASRIKAV
uniref:Putative 14.heat shock protein-like n=1 Tax=Davidia involucrata TaxID=16924 RepID=A0A5B7A8N2_DAVIN